MAEYVERGNDSFVIEREIGKWAWNLPDFLQVGHSRTAPRTYKCLPNLPAQVFTHPKEGGPINGIFMLHNESYWKISVPHIKLSGRCYTYDPPFESMPGWWYGIRQVLKWKKLGTR